MSLTRFGAEGFRNLAPFEIHPSSGINLVVGDNGAGKTSLLEAIHFLSRGRSFRTNRLDRIRQRGLNDLQVYGSVSTPNSPSTTIGVRKSGRGTLIRVGGHPVTRFSTLARLLPVVTIGSESHRLIEDGPELRRRFLDWGVFHMEHPQLPAWHQYDLALRQRNAAIRNKLPKAQIRLWNEPIGVAGEIISAVRKGLLTETAPHFAASAARLLPQHKLTIQYRPGWRTEEMTLLEALNQSTDDDLRRGFTQNGPHRAELRVLDGDVDIRESLSRGQQKLLVSSMLIAQALYLHDITTKEPILIYDDLPAELDTHKRSALAGLIQTHPGQVFLSAIDPVSITPLFHMEHNMFHVEQGRISQVI